MHSGAFDPFTQAIAAAHRPGAWVHIDGSFGLLADGTAWMSGSRWHGQTVLRVPVSNWSTTGDDVARSLAALRRAASEPFKDQE